MAGYGVLAKNQIIDFRTKLNPSTRKVMASPPTITYTTAATIASPTTYPAVNGTNVNHGPFTFSSAGKPTRHGAAFPDYNFIRFENISGTDTNSDNNWWKVSVEHTGSAIEMRVKGIAGYISAKVNGEWVSLTPQTVTADGSQSYYYLSFGSSANRRIDFYGTGTVFGGILTAATDTLLPAKLNGPRLMVLGDSFCEGTGATPRFQGYVGQLSDYLGLEDVWCSGYGGTGLLNDGSTKLTYRERVAADVIYFSPDIVMIQNSINDAGYSAALLSAELTLLIGEIKASLPNTRILITSPMSNTGVSNITKEQWERRIAYKDLAVQLNCGYVDILDLGLPSTITPQQLTLTASASAGATSVSTASGNNPNPLAVYEFPDKTRFRIKSTSGSNPFVCTIDSGLKTAQASGVVATEVGGCFWTGTGKVGTTTGYGNCDVFVSSDGDHPTQLAHDNLAIMMANIIYKII